jgi:hypothetical protein
MKKINYKLKKISNGIFLCSIKNSYDLSMTFCRLQEFYESPFKEIRGKKFNLLDFIKLYSSKQGDGSFTYPVDWVGFNVPGPIVDKHFKVGIDDINEYDKVMKNIHTTINKDVKKKNHYYLIGAVNNDKETIYHELCHAFYFLDSNYKQDVTKIIKKLLPSIYVEIKESLLEIGYSKEVIDDEIQAYISTCCSVLGDIKLNKKEKKNYLQVEKLLIQNFNHYKKLNKIKI